MWYFNHTDAVKIPHLDGGSLEKLIRLA